MGKFLKGLMVVGLMCLGSALVAKADSLPATGSVTGSGPYTVTYTNVAVTYVEPLNGNPPGNFYCDGCTANETVTFTNVGGTGGVGIEVGLPTPATLTNGTTGPGGGAPDYPAGMVIPGSCTNAAPASCLATTTPYFVLLNADSTGLQINSALTLLTTSGSYETPGEEVCVLDKSDAANDCNPNTNYGPNDLETTTNVSETGGVFSIVDNSLGVDITFSTVPTTTPEPSSLLTLGSGLLGLLGFGFRRKGLV